MTTVGVRELKAHLSEYLARARAGEVIIVTERGKPVAQLSAPAESGVDTIWALVRAGKAEWSGRKPGRVEPVKGLKEGVSVSDLIIRERQEGF